MRELCTKCAKLYKRCGQAPWSRFAEKGFKPAKAMLVKSQGSERLGKVTVKDRGKYDSEGRTQANHLMRRRDYARSQLGFYIRSRMSLGATCLLPKRLPVQRWPDFESGFCTKRGNLSH
jgi:hypothetical protein